MKKFLCYDTDDAASGKINVDNRGMLKPNSTVPSTNGATNQQLVTNSNGNVQWEDRLAYDGNRIVVEMDAEDNEDEESPIAKDFYVKVTDEIPEWALVEGTQVKVWSSLFPDDRNPFMDTIYFNSNFGMFTDRIGNFLVVEKETILPTLEDSRLSEKHFPEKGIYVYGVQLKDGTILGVTGIALATSDTPEITWDGNIEFTKIIDPKYIPADHINSLIDAKLGVIENGSY